MSQKSSPPKTFWNIFIYAKRISVKFCHSVASVYPHTITNFGRFILIFNKMALIFLEVLIVFYRFKFRVSTVRWFSRRLYNVRCWRTDGILLLVGLHVDTADDLIQRRQQFGANTVPTKKSRMFLHFLWEATQDMTLIILIVAAIVAFGLSFYEPPETTESVCKRAACL